MIIKQVKGVGPIPCDVMILGEAPGREENSRGVPFIGKTGKELDNTYLPLLGLQRSEVRIDNTIQFFSPHTPSFKSISESIPNLYERIRKVNPGFVIALGACSNTALKSEPVVIERLRGRAYLNESLGCVVIPCIHPAAGLREGRSMLWCLEDFKLAKAYIDGKSIPPEPVKSNYHVVEVHHPSEFIGLLSGQEAISIDTEDVQGIPFSVQLAVRNGKLMGIFIDAHIPELISEMMVYLRGCPNLIFHHSLHDVAMLDKLGFGSINFVGKLHDTMVLAQHRGDQPKGLKSLTYRWLNELMTDYMDMVKPYQNELSLQYIKQALTIEYDDIPETMIWKKFDKTSKWETLNPYHPQNIGKRLSRLMYRYEGWPEDIIQSHINEYRKKLIRETLGMKSVRKVDIDRLWDDVVTAGTTGSDSTNLDVIIKQYSGNPEIDLKKSWSNMKNKRQVIKRWGKMPLASIANVPHDIAVDYSVRDSINTLRLWEVMK